MWSLKLKIHQSDQTSNFKLRNKIFIIFNTATINGLFCSHLAYCLFYFRINDFSFLCGATRRPTRQEAMAMLVERKSLLSILMFISIVWVVTLQWNIFYPMIFYRKYCEWPLKLKRFIIDQGPVFHFRLGQIYRKIQDSKGKIESWWDTRSEEASLPCALSAYAY